MTTREEMISRFAEYEKNGNLYGIPVSYTPVCKHRGAMVSRCSCGADRFICGVLGIPVRTKARRDHPNDIICGEACAKFAI